MAKANDKNTGKKKTDRKGGQKMSGRNQEASKAGSKQNH